MDSFLCDFSISLTDGRQKFEARSVYAVQNLNTSNQTIDLKCINQRFGYLRDLDLSAPRDEEVTVLIGMDVPLAHLQLGYRLPPDNRPGPIGLRTPFGWCVIGPLTGQVLSQRSSIRRLRRLQPDNAKLQDMIDKFWKLESFGAKLERPVSLDDQRVNELLESTTKRVGDRYEVGLLKRSPRVNLTNNYQAALARLFSNEKRCRRDLNYADRYRRFIEELVRNGHARLISSDKGAAVEGEVWYLPHHGFVNPNKPDKLRVAFDASARHHGKSLNDELLTGPDLLTSLFGVLIRFRHFKRAVTLSM